jgi:hypothetical protein
MCDPSRTALTAWALCLGLLSIAASSPSAALAQARDPADGGPELMSTSDAGALAPDQPADSAEPSVLDAAMGAADRPEDASAPPLAASDAAAPASEQTDPTAESEAVRQFADWVIATGDNHDRPFAIIDKVQAQVVVFGADGQRKGSGPSLLGLARGDDSVPGIGARKMSSIRPGERTTPAGRFLASYGPGKGKAKGVLWVDYDTAISLHPVVTANPKERRLQRLRSPTPQDNRITYGCINVSGTFYRDVVRPTFTGKTVVVYVLPETKTLTEVFPSFRVMARAATDAAASSSAMSVEDSAPVDPAHL